MCCLVPRELLKLAHYHVPTQSEETAGAISVRVDATHCWDTLDPTYVIREQFTEAHQPAKDFAGRDQGDCEADAGLVTRRKRRRRDSGMVLECGIPIVSTSFRIRRAELNLSSLFDL